MNVEKLKNKARKLELKDPQKAIDAYLEIIRALEGTPEMDDELALYNKVGDLYLKVRNVNAATDMYERAVNRYTESGFPNNAIALCNKILRSAPGRTHVYLKLAQLMLQRGFLAEAKKNFVEYAERMANDGKLDEAFEALKRFADLSPENEEIRLMLVEQLKAAARDDEAREQIDRLVASADGTKDEARASQILEKVRAVDPEYDVDQPSKPSDELIFISLDDEPVASEPPPPPSISKEPEPVVEPEPQEPMIEFEPTSMVEGQHDITLDDGAALEIERISTPDFVSGDELDTSVPTLEGLETRQEFSTVDASSDTEALEIERTGFEDGSGDTEDLSFLDAGADSLGLEESDEEGTAGLEVPELDLGGFDQDELVGASGADGSSGVAGFSDDTSNGDLEMIDTSERRDDSADLTGDGAFGDDFRPSPDADQDVLYEVGVSEFDDEATTGTDDDQPVSGPAIADDFGDDLQLIVPDHDAVADPVAPSESTVESLGAALAEQPDDNFLRRRFAEALIEAGDHERGLAELDATLSGFESKGDWSHASAVAEEILRIEPNSVVHHQKQVEYTYRSGDRQQLIRAYLGLANALFRSGDLDRARSIFERVLEQDPQNASARDGLATLTPAEPEPVAAGGQDRKSYVDLGEFILGDEEPVRDTRMRVQEEEPSGDEQRDFNDMLQQFKRGIEENLDEEDTQAHYDLGVAFKEMGLIDEAIGEFQKALRSLETRLQSAEMLGLCFFEKGQFEVASTVLRRAIEGDPSSDQAKIGLLYWLGRCEEEQSRPAEALRQYQRVFAVDIGFMDVGERVDALVKATS